MNISLLNLLHLSDPTLPIGGFSHSAGLETYVQLNIVKDRASATEFIKEMLGKNVHFTDAALVSLVYDAAANGQLEIIVQLDQECTAVKLPMEMRQASKKLGMRLLKIFESHLNNEIVIAYKKLLQSQIVNGNYCIVFGIIAHALAIAKQDALFGFYYNVTAGFVTNSVKLVPLGQQDGQEILLSLMPLMHSLATQSMNPDKNLIGLCCTGFDIRSMQHEQLYSRLYMS